MQIQGRKYYFASFVNTEQIRQERRLLVFLPLLITVFIALFFIVLGLVPKFKQTILIQNIENEIPNYCECKVIILLTH